MTHNCVINLHRLTVVEKYLSISIIQNSAVLKNMFTKKIMYKQLYSAGLIRSIELFRLVVDH